MDSAMEQVFQIMLGRLECEIRANAVSRENYANLLAEYERLRNAKTKPVNADMIYALMQSMSGGKKIDAIKAYRSLTDAGLKESKDIVESVMDRERA